MSSVHVQKLHTLTGHRDCVYTLEKSGERDIFFSAGGDGMVAQWNLNHPEIGASIAQLPNSIYALHALPEKELLLVGHNYEGIHLIDWKNKIETSSLKLTDTAIFDIKSWNGNCFVASGDGSVTVVNYEKMSIQNRLIHSQKNARSIAINPVAGEIAVGYSDNFIRIFDIDSFSLKQEWMAHTNSVFTVNYTPDFNFLLSGSRDARLKAWNAKENYTGYQDIAAHLYAINHIEFSPDGKHFVTCSMDKSVKVWQLPDLTLLKVIDKARHAGHGTSVNKMLWSTFNNQLVSASDDRTISIWDVIF